MKAAIIAVIVATLVVVSATPVAERGVTYPAPWPTIKEKAIEYKKLLDLTFNVMRVICMNAGPSGMLLSENIIISHQRTNRVLTHVFDKIESRSLNCDDTKHFSEEVVNIFMEVIRTLLESLDLSPEIKNRIRAIFAGTILDSSKLVNMLMTLLGCPSNP